MDRAGTIAQRSIQAAARPNGSERRAHARMGGVIPGHERECRPQRTASSSQPITLRRCRTTISVPAIVELTAKAPNATSKNRL